MTLTPAQIARLHPISTAPHDGLTHRLAWRDGDVWHATWGQWHTARLRWEADPVLMTTREFPATPTHWVRDE